MRIGKSFINLSVNRTFPGALSYSHVVTAISTLSPASEIDRIFGPVVQARTYRHLLYALISFPLGITYFVMMITGLSVSAGTAIILIGFVFLAVTLMLALTFGRVERSLTQYLLGATFEPPASPRGLRALYTDRRAWTSLIYLLLRFPIGVAGFAAVPMLSVHAWPPPCCIPWCPS